MNWNWIEPDRIDWININAGKNHQSLMGDSIERFVSIEIQLKDSVDNWKTISASSAWANISWKKDKRRISPDSISPWLIPLSTYYKWARWIKFQLAVIYGLPRRHSNSCKTFKSEKIRIHFMNILGLAASFKAKNRPDPTRQ